ncbi:HCP-like protein [Glarea lozoyensis ATCC 20868]|uniref:HCP-like protein n=1 Tax=Glarea lozoyensis (strain ATCC 20868 / MF5171) TaxID=1116229 RepID=S3CDR9_GLAL2|nr:HCP-like protein [Glarea lozoyensis ATCC 20868]EPE24160.1 HCP-like protein [Glarea lozoyensis ATCC 20868]
MTEEDEGALFEQNVKDLWDVHLQSIHQFHQTRTAQDLENSIQAGEKALTAIPKHHVCWSAIACNHSDNLTERARENEFKEDLVSAISLLHEVLAVVPDTPAQRPIHWHTLSRAMHETYEQDGTPDDLESAIHYSQLAVNSVESDNPHYADFLGQLTQCLASRSASRLTSNLLDLGEAIRLARGALDPTNANQLHDLALLLKSYSEHTGLPEPLEEAITLNQRSLGINIDDRHRCWYLNSLGLMFCSRYTFTEHPIDLDESIKCGRRAVALAGKTNESEMDNVNYAICLMNLSDSIGCRSDINHDMVDIEEAVQFAEQAQTMVAENHSLRSRFLSCMSNQLLRRSTESLSETDLTRAGQLAENAVSLGSKDYSQYAYHLRGLSKILFLDFQRNGSPESIQKSIMLLEESITSGLNTNYATLSATTNELAQRYYSLSNTTGSLTNLNKAVDMLSNLFEVCPTGHPHQRMVMMNVAHVLHARFDRLGILSDLKQAIELTEEALDYSPDMNVPLDFQLLCELLSHRYQRLRDIKDLDRSIVISRKLDSNELGKDLYESFKGGKNRNHLLEAIEELKNTIGRMPEGQPVATYQLSLSNALRDNLKLENSTSSDEWSYAIQLGKKAVSGLPQKHPNRVEALHSLAHIIEDSPFQSAEDEEAGLEYCEEALNLEAGPPLDRIRVAMHMFNSYKKMGNWKKARQAAEYFIYTLVLKLLLRLLPLQDQQYLLQSLNEASSKGAGAILQDGGSSCDAIALLEAGRTMITNISIVSRGNIPELARVDPQLHAEYLELRNVVSAPVHDEQIEENHNHSHAAGGHRLHLIRSTVTSRLAERARLIKKLEDLEAKICSVLGIEHLNAPIEAESLKQLATEGPIVLFNTAVFRTDALIITHSEISSLNLGKLDYHDVRAKINKLVGPGQLAKGKRSTKFDRQQELRDILEWLWTTAVQPVLAHLDLIKENLTDIPTRIWWVNSGLLGLAPLHAAGNSKQWASEYVVSTYTASIRSLQYAREKAHRHAILSDPTILVISMPTTAENKTPLTSEMEENVVKECMTIEPTILQTPTREAVLEAMPNHDFVHFACHGIANAEDPSSGGLLVGPAHEDKVQYITIEQLSNLSHERAQIAYLSACSTAENSSLKLLDEAIHTANAFQVMGFPHVIGTLWEASNRVAPKITKIFYETLMRDIKTGHVASDVVARSLWQALCVWRKEKPNDYLSWACFVHLGA